MSALSVLCRASRSELEEYAEWLTPEVIQAVEELRLCTRRANETLRAYRRAANAHDQGEMDRLYVLRNAQSEATWIAQRELEELFLGEGR